MTTSVCRSTGASVGVDGSSSFKKRYSYGGIASCSSAFGGVFQSSVGPHGYPIASAADLMCR